MADYIVQEQKVKADAKSRNWQFTWNNYTEEEEVYVQQIAKQAKYLCYGREKGEQGTPHLQGMVCFKNAKPFSTVRNLFKNNHVEICKNVKALITYCQKDGDVWEFGMKPQKNGGDGMMEIAERNKTLLTRPLCELVDSGEVNLRELETLKRAKRAYEMEKRQLEAENEMEEFEPREGWQKELVEMLRGEPDNRTVHWYVDVDGGKGKTTFCRGYKEKKLFYTTGGKYADIFYAYEYQPVVVFDLTREKMDSVPYGAMEALKNGLVFSGKYESQQKRFKSPWVIVMANFWPDRSKLSMDRWRIHNLCPEKPEFENERFIL